MIATASVALHPSSVNARASRFESPYLVYAEKLKTTQVYLRDCSPASPFALMLFGGALRQLVEPHSSDRVISVDEWIRFRVPRRAEELVVGIRAQLDALLRQKIANPALELSAAGDEVLAAVKALLESAPPLLC